MISGGSGSDVLSGGAGDDVLCGGPGADVLQGEAGDDTFLFSTDATWSAGFLCRNDGSPGHPGSSATVAITGRVASWDAMDGGSGSDSLVGTAGNDIIVLDDAISPSPGGQQPRFTRIETIRAGTGDDIVDLTSSRWACGDVTVDGEGGDDVLWTSSGNDLLLGGAGNDTLDGGFGSDRMAGGAGNDTYVFGRGYGSDTISEDDASPENTDRASFLPGIGPSQIWLRHVGNNLEAGIIGTTDKLTLENWYLGSSYHVEQFKAADGRLLLDTQVENLVQAMAAFAPPPPGQTTLSPAYQDSLAPVIAANWR